MSLASRPPARRTRRAAIAAAAALALAAVVVASSLGWVNATFPGFLLMGNRVVPSITLGDWTGTREAPIFQRQVVALDGVPVESAGAVYRRVAEHPPGRAFRYTLRGGGIDEDRVIPSMPFALRDYVLLFGALLLNGLIFTAVGIAVWVLGPRGPATAGVVAFALDVGLFCLTAMDLYGPGLLFRVHVTTEALFPAVLLHLMLVFPVVRLGRLLRPALALVYALGLALVALYQWHLHDPERYSQIHNLCMALAGVAGVGLIASGAQAYRTSTSFLVRKRLGVIALGTVAGFALPAWLLTVSALAGGTVAINVAAFTAFLFPLSLAYAAIKHDLFEIDALLRRGLGYLALTGTVAAAYAVAVLGSGLLLQRADVAQSPAFTLAFFLLLTLLLNPMRDRLQRVVDRLYDRPSHDPQRTLEQASGALAATLDLDDIHRLTVDTIADALLLERASLWIRDAGGRLAPVAARGPAPSACLALPAEHPLLGHLQRANRALSVHDFVDGPLRGAGAEACVGALAALGAELVLPLARGDLSGFLALGAKKSRTLYTLDDLKFLSTLANQVAVAIRNAQAYRKIEELNADLERKVARRTGELAATNRELGESLRELERAYTDLQRSQENLVRAEKMAALGRVTAGIAHEVNTPLGAALNSLKVCEELAGEYARSIGDPEVTDDDHRQIAAELAELIGNVRRWTDKAAGYIRGIKAHTRSLSDVQERSFEVAQLVDDTLLLLAHRLRLSSCRVTVECPDGVTLYGDPGKLAQVLTNLITNAVDAYEGRDGAIAIRVRARAAEVEIDVEDRGCGIAPENLGRVFEELFTTKPPGKGTGLGLSISRDIVGDCFAGRIAVESAPGRGSRFTLVLPRRAPAEGRGEARATAAG